jgi:hypothetical protein
LNGAASEDQAFAAGKPGFKPGAIAAAPMEAWSNSLRVIWDFIGRMPPLNRCVSSETRI